MQRLLRVVEERRRQLESSTRDGGMLDGAATVTAVDAALESTVRSNVEQEQEAARMMTHGHGQSHITVVGIRLKLIYIYILSFMFIILIFYLCFFYLKNPSTMNHNPSLQTTPSQPSTNNIQFARALYDFQGQTPQEISFRKGDWIGVI